jgi:hypothetical protein
LFLLDELLHGANANDRRIRAEGIVHALLNRGAIGLVSTHDLALAGIGGSLNGQLCNVHFQEEFENGRMLFDYRLRAGMVTKEQWAGVDAVDWVGCVTISFRRLRSRPIWWASLDSGKTSDRGA